jgi:hypothetical protein
MWHLMLLLASNYTVTKQYFLGRDNVPILYKNMIVNPVKAIAKELDLIEPDRGLNFQYTVYEIDRYNKLKKNTSTLNYSLSFPQKTIALATSESNSQFSESRMVAPTLLLERPKKYSYLKLKKLVSQASSSTIPTIDTEREIEKIQKNTENIELNKEESTPSTIPPQNTNNNEQLKKSSTGPSKIEDLEITNYFVDRQYRFSPWQNSEIKNEPNELQPNNTSELNVEPQDSNNSPKEITQISPSNPNLELDRYYIDRNYRLPELKIPEFKPDILEGEFKPSRPELTPEQEDKAARQVLRGLISNNAKKYPYILNNSDKLIFEPNNYPLSNQNLIIDLKYKTENNNSDSTINNDVRGLTDWKASYYPSEGQFFWILDNNTVVIETQGINYGSSNQGRSVSNRYTQNATSSINFWGIQTAWAFPPQIGSLIGKENVRVTTVAIDIQTPEAISLQSPVLVLKDNLLAGEPLILSDNTDFGKTYSPIGGGALFENLEADNSPTFLQGFPTVNLQGLLDGGIKFELGTIIPEENLAKIGLVWGDFFTGADYTFKPIYTSGGGVKGNQPAPFYGPLRDEYLANKDILTLLSNPYLTPEQKDFHYLNSLWWNSFGPGQAKIRTILGEQESENWNRFTINMFFNRTQLHYDPEEISMNYTNFFANPGLALTYTRSFSEIDMEQTLANNLWMLTAVFFDALDAGNLNNNLEEARERFNQRIPLSKLNTKSTPEQRNAMNQRLNTTLSGINDTTNLTQVLGSLTLVGDVTPSDSVLLQFKTGFYRRSVQFFGEESEGWSPESPVYIRKLHHNELGPLTYQGVNLPTQQTQITPEPSNHKARAYAIITTPDGKSQVQPLYSIDRTVLTTVPFPDAKRPADIESGLFTLTKHRQRSVTTHSYVGDLYLPSIEWSLAGSSGKFYYNLAVGSWFNFTPDSAPKVSKNSYSLLDESDFGVYASAELKWILDSLEVTPDRKYYEYSKHIPSLKAKWNSSANRLNIASITPSYTFIWQNPAIVAFSANFLTYTPQEINDIVEGTSQGEFVFTNFSSFDWKDILRLTSSVEVGRDTFFDTRIIFPLIKDDIKKISFGAYYRNYKTITQGLESRVDAESFGGIVEYRHLGSDSYINANLGSTDGEFEAIINVGIRLGL